MKLEEFNTSEHDILVKYNLLSEEAIDTFMASLDQPDWDETTDLSDWRSRVPTGLKERWQRMSRNSKLRIYDMAMMAATGGPWR